MQAVIRTTLVASLLAACGSSPHASPDASTTGSGDSGSGGGTGGFFVHGWSDPKLPGAVGNNATVTDADFWLTSLRVIGDADPGDDRTTADPGHIYWSDEGSGPPAVHFADAPSGLYSKVAVALDGLVVDSSYDIKGSVDFGSAGTKSFHIHDLAPMNISLDINNTLQPGSEVDVTIHIDFTAAIGVVDFSSLDTDDGALDLDTLDSQMPAFRTALQNSFSIAGGSTGSSSPP